jgi:hypothetical protein
MGFVMALVLTAVGLAAIGLLIHILKWSLILAIVLAIAAVVTGVRVAGRAGSRT